MSDQQVRDAALRVLESRGRSLSPAQGDRIDSLVRTALSADNRDMDGAELARRLLISESSAYRSAFLQLMTSPHPVLTGEEAEAVRSMQRLEYRAMGEGSGPVGAYGLGGIGPEGADGRQLPPLGRRRRPTTLLPAPISGRRAAAMWVIPSR